jgi:hypothetical protein
MVHGSRSRCVCVSWVRSTKDDGTSKYNQGRWQVQPRGDGKLRCTYTQIVANTERDDDIRCGCTLAALHVISMNPGIRWDYHLNPKVWWTHVSWVPGLLICSDDEGRWCVPLMWAAEVCFWKERNIKRLNDWFIDLIFAADMGCWHVPLVLEICFGQMMGTYWHTGTVQHAACEDSN